MDTFQSANSKQNLPEQIPLLREAREAEGDLPDPPTNYTTPLNSDITKLELKRALATIKKVKVATGVDRVSYGMLGELPQTYVDLLLSDDDVMFHFRLKTKSLIETSK